MTHEITSRTAWNILTSDRTAALIDVRTPQEWATSGVVDMTSLGNEVAYIPWRLLLDYDVNARFLSELERLAPDKIRPLLFLCRVGGRSYEAAIAAKQAGYRQTYNITAGFEGTPGAARGWKAEGLPWVRGNASSGQ